MIATLNPRRSTNGGNDSAARRRRNRRPRRLAALGYLPQGPVLEGLIEIEKLLLVVLYDAPTGHGQQPCGWPDSAAPPSPGA